MPGGGGDGVVVDAVTKVVGVVVVDVDVDAVDEGDVGVLEVGDDDVVDVGAVVVPRNSSRSNEVGLTTTELVGSSVVDDGSVVDVASSSVVVLDAVDEDVVGVIDVVVVLDDGSQSKAIGIDDHRAGQRRRRQQRGRRTPAPSSWSMSSCSTSSTRTLSVSSTWSSCSMTHSQGNWDRHPPSWSAASSTTAA